ncbi:MAG: hypothetical protein ACXWLH_06120 [Candidatus Saccharimonadales bacterium]
MVSPEEFEQIKNCAETQTGKLVEAVDLIGLSEPARRALFEELSKNYGQLAGEIAASATVSIEAVEESPVEVKSQPGSDEEQQAAFDQLEQLRADKPEKFEQARLASARRRGYESRPEFGRADKPKHIPLRTSLPPTDPANPPIAAAQPDAEESIDAMLQPLADLPNIDLNPDTKISAISPKEKVQSLLLDPDVRARAISQLAYESNRGPTGRFVKVKTDRLADILPKKVAELFGIETVEDALIVDVTIRIHEAIKIVSGIYDSVNQNYSQVTKFKEVRELAEQYLAVRDIIFYWKLVADGFYTSDNVVQRDDAGAAMGGSIANRTVKPMTKADALWMVDNQISDEKFATAINNSRRRG